MAGPLEAADAVAEAEAAGILSLKEDHIRFSHPLLEAAVWSSTPLASRWRLHRQLAELLTDPEEKAKHLAAVAHRPDEKVAGVLVAAGRHARARGAPDAAAGLYERSVRLTPVIDSEDRLRRTIDAATCHVEAGDDAHARQLLERVVAEAPRGPMRAEALLQLSNVCSRLENATTAVALLEQALTETGDGGLLRSAVLRRLAYLCSASGNIIGGMHHAREALDLLDGSTDNGALAEALAHLTMTEFLLGHGFAAERMDRAVALEETTAFVPVESRPSLIHALILLWTDEPDSARVVVGNLRRRLLEEGYESAMAYTSWVLAWVQLATGNLDQAARHVQEGTRIAQANHEVAIEGLLLAVAAEVHTWIGEVDAARAAAERGLDRSRQTGLGSGVVFNTTALGFLELSLGQALAAHRCLGPIADLQMPFGAGEPSVLRFFPDEIEALVALGETERGATLLEPFEARAHALGRRWAIAAAARCRALLAAAMGDSEGALATLDVALEMHRDLPNPLEHGRTLVVKGRIHRRGKQKQHARESLRQAEEIFERHGAKLWAETARAELARVGGRPSAPTELTATEQRVAELAATGLTNREVAQAAFMAPKSVENVLARVYRKLGIGSRAELGARMAARRSSSGA